jgi:hypothetical protein
MDKDLSSLSPNEKLFAAGFLPIESHIVCAYVQGTHGKVKSCLEYLWSILFAPDSWRGRFAGDVQR